MPPPPRQGTGFVSLGDYLSANKQPLDTAYQAATGDVTGAAQAARVAAGALAPEAAAAGTAQAGQDWQTYQNQGGPLGAPARMQGTTVTGLPYTPFTGTPGQYDPTQGSAYSQLVGAVTKENQAGGAIQNQAGLAGNFYDGAGGSGFNASLLEGAHGGDLAQAGQAAQADTAQNYLGPGVQNAYTSAYNQAASPYRAQAPVPGSLGAGSPTGGSRRAPGSAPAGGARGPGAEPAEPAEPAPTGGPGGPRRRGVPNSPPIIRQPGGL